MVFSSITFLFFFLPVSFFVSLVFPKIQAKNIVLLVLSLLFYAWGEPVYVFLMIFSVALNYAVAFLIVRAGDKLGKKILASGIVLNFGILFYFKYAAFAIKLLIPALAKFGFSPIVPSVALPIGISLYTFQIVSYLVDVYRNPKLLQKNPLNLGFYISFFPQLIAGPIVRYHDVNEQIKNRSVSFDRTVCALERFVLGLGKKVLLANVFALYADTVLNAPMGDYAPVYAWLSMLAYSLQIYFDFSGYSDMAIGLGKLFGFDFSENFDHPYEARSITDFWRRWHISLSSWFREYLYIPLGGNRKGYFRTCLNIFIVFLATGIWHGAAVNFIVWGVGHGILRIFEKILSESGISRFFDAAESRLLCGTKNFVTRLYALAAVYFLWIFFRNGTKTGMSLIKKMFDFSSDSSTVLKIQLLYNTRAVFVFAVGIILCVSWKTALKNLWKIRFFQEKKVVSAMVAAKYFALALIFVLSVSCLMSNSYNPFIYFRF